VKIIVFAVAVVASILVIYVTTPASQRSLRRCARITVLLPIAIPMLIGVLLLECFGPKPTETE
jgi:hypothetical protein